MILNLKNMSQKQERGRPKKETTAKPFVIRIDDDLKASANLKAESENRSLNGFIVNLIKQAIA